MSSGSVVAFSGGVGGAKLALGLAEVLPPDRLTLVVNTGDDEEFFGLHVSPDLDTVMYTLAGVVNPATGWGVEAETFHALEMLGRYGTPTWFSLGDRDLATHILRRQRLDEGRTLSEVTEELSQRLGVRHPILPMSDHPVRTVVETDEGDLPFQSYFVERRCEPKVRGLRFERAADALPGPAVVRALRSASTLIFCPSNPWLSVEPILAVPGIREAVRSFRGPRLAVSPIVGGRALRGPADKIMSELGYEVSTIGIADYYQGLSDTLVIDETDRADAASIEKRGLSAYTASTVMRNKEDKVALARVLCRIADVATEQVEESRTS